MSDDDKSSPSIQTLALKAMNKMAAPGLTWEPWHELYWALQSIAALSAAPQDTAPKGKSRVVAPLLAELERLRQWFLDRQDRPGCSSQAIHVGMVLDAHKRNSERNSET